LIVRQRTGRYIIKGVAKEEHFVGLSINQSGWLVFVTNKGRVGTVSNDLSQASELVQLPGYEKLDVLIHWLRIEIIVFILSVISI
jgi:hypothetical protein